MAKARSLSLAEPPGPRRTRIENLDVLRGLAVIGIFVVNIQALAMTPFGYANPTVEADFGPEGRLVWTLIQALFQMKFITLFCGLFGIGILIQSGEGGDDGRDVRHARRMAWLFAIGAAHAYLIWYGDILLPYAIAGLLLMGARGWGAGRLALIGFALTLLSTVLILGAGLSAASLTPEEYADFIAEAWAPPPETVAAQQALFRLPWIERVPGLADLVTERELEQSVYFMPRFAGVMMLGMALWKSGLFDGRWSGRALWLAAALAPLGALVTWGLVELEILVRFDIVLIAPLQALVSLIALPQALGYAALVVLLSGAPALTLARVPLAAVGRMALSCYLSCSLVGALMFYGPPGLGLIGELTRVEQMGVVLWVSVGLLALSTAWLSVFAFGPAEWAWRSLTYGRLQPLLRAVPAAGVRIRRRR
jgi:uncharacterized protein